MTGLYGGLKVFYDFLKSGTGLWYLKQNPWGQAEPLGQTLPVLWGKSSSFLAPLLCLSLLGAWSICRIAHASGEEKAGLLEQEPYLIKEEEIKESTLALDPEKQTTTAHPKAPQEQKTHSVQREGPQRKKKSSSSKKKHQWLLFEWLNTNHISLEWAYGFLDHEQKDLYAPLLLKQKVTKSFKHEALIFLNFHHNIIQFPYILHWGLRGSMGLARNYDLQSDFFIPFNLSGILSLKITKHQPFVPFVEGGLSSWNRNLNNHFSAIFPYWTVGAFISLSLFKPSLRWTFPNDYGFKDLGFVVEWRNHVSPFTKEKRGPFLRTLHVGLYMAF